MQFPESWLREFCDPPLSSQALADLLTMSGLEVESLDPVAPPVGGVIVGEIVEAEPHPNADRLRVCRVNAGAHSKDGLLQIVCGAPNARVGLKAPLALVGAELPPGEDGMHHGGPGRRQNRFGEGRRDFGGPWRPPLQRPASESHQPTW